MKRTNLIALACTFLTGAMLLFPSSARAHCDTLDGPVVRDAMAAIASRDVTPVLKWVRPADEPEVRAAFEKALVVRVESEAARELADTYFFETLVRVHRASEGAPYTGLKPAGSATHGEAAADRSLETGSPDPIVAHLTRALADGIRDRFDKVSAAKTKAEASVEEGRDYVAAYVEYLHYVSGMLERIEGGAEHGHPEGRER